MRIPLSLQIALRFHRKQQNRKGMVSIIAMISTISISLGVMVLIIVLSVINGFERELNQRILAVVAHGEIEPVNPPFDNWLTLIKSIEQMPGIIAATPYIHFNSIIESAEKQQVIQVKAVDPEQEKRLSSLPNFMLNNAWHNFVAHKQQIILGKGIATTLHVKPGDWLTMVISHADVDINRLQFKRIRLQVSGIFALSSQIDNHFALIPLADAQEYLNKGDDIDGIAMKVNDIYHANQIIRYVGKNINRSVFIRSWIETYGYMYRDINMMRSIICLAMILVIGVACFNIVSTLTIVVKDKRAEIAILRTLGTKESFVYAIFIWYGLLVGLLGGLLGATIGVVIATYLTTLAKFIEQLLDLSLLSSNVYFINFIPTELSWTNVIGVLGAAMLLSLVASWYPAQRASKINPVTILKEK
ncbi:lipoprotein-releasing ABC transporter permease subunit LolE [Candidatus Palibaumannia cicadellinicola]|uniref:Lipoprotein releasing system, transmembrane protein LolE n=1 Tax=Baumannia cicadellinicola subsp. Homalodisca coagulata TaxID=374463 RepID=Q1LT49_BAUCH|nr:lipoprotein-releasing ABC transporter permease subunit LolE [Candidatus Baumannia cicadellinicola]ABF14168.1 lipoprotein releasing system, transmembrane protein LolE [Baumannia cicadellinicola str. Hc (Homalodisca coagulata)]MBS0032809.1 lipoprotein-releasing ABC transporter permease subunit LolE [Candidatus Baumannia cicadellinicola]MBS0032846.1 lipoprotein-releasing ABC transporter permease subunit LolE [Candidatus Baumannia cicadellinicola]MCJ7462095.1 lipoprotein-releasing ABC transporte